MKTKNNSGDSGHLLPDGNRFYRWLNRFLTIDLLFILFLSLVVRLAYYCCLKDTLLTDSPSYLNFSANIFKGEIDSFRTPVYPYFIKLIGLFYKQSIVGGVIWWQCFVSFLSIMIFYGIVKNIFANKKAVNGATIIYGLMLPVINFDKTILTESLSVTFTLIMLNLSVRYIKKPSAVNAILISLFSFAAIMLRPSYMFLLPVVAVFWIFRFWVYKERRLAVWGIVCLGLIMPALAGYAYLNKKQHGFYGISIVSAVNQLDILICNDLYKYGNDKELIADIKTGMTKPQPLGGYWNLVKDMFAKYPPQKIADFNSWCIQHNFKAYLTSTYHAATRIKNENIFTHAGTYKTNTLANLFVGIESFMFIPFSAIYILLVLDMAFLIVRVVKHRHLQWFRLILWAIIAGTLAIAIVGAPGEYQRLILSAIPCLLILIFVYIDKILTAIDPKKLNDYAMPGDYRSLRQSNARVGHHQ